jgi:hypothetical protein
MGEVQGGFLLDEENSVTLSLEFEVLGSVPRNYHS